MPQFPEAASFEHLLDAHVTLEAPEQVGAGPYGSRSVHIVTGGKFEGAKLRGKVRAGGGDWLLTSASHNELDVRATFETDDGALLFVSYRGVLNVAPDVAGKIFAGQEVDHTTEYYFRTTPRFETGDERYAWLNRLVTVGYGYFGPGKVGYRLFAVL